MNATKNPVFTIGHSTHSLDAFVTLLRQHDVTALADVRSAPHSRYNSQLDCCVLDWLRSRALLLQACRL